MVGDEQVSLDVATLHTRGETQVFDLATGGHLQTLRCCDTVAKVRFASVMPHGSIVEVVSGPREVGARVFDLTGMLSQSATGKQYPYLLWEADVVGKALFQMDEGSTILFAISQLEIFSAAARLGRQSCSATVLLLLCCGLCMLWRRYDIVAVPLRHRYC